jgi:hypothetical protein
MSESEMQAELERLRAENAQLKSKDKGGLTLKVSEKGGVSLYGMGRFPVTLYKEQWLRILASAPEIEGPDRNLLSLREREDPRPGPLRDLLHAKTAGCRVFRGPARAGLRAGWICL